MIYVYEYEECAAPAVMRDAALRLPCRLRQEFLRIRDPKRQGEHVCGWLLLEKALRDVYGISSLEQMEIDRSGHGKPYSRAYPQIRFNLSHCDTACAVIVSQYEAGVDVENLFPYRPSLARKVCHDQEWEYLRTLPEGSRALEESLRMLWSVKESMVKWNGRGLGYGLNRLNLLPLLKGRAAQGDGQEKIWRFHFKHTDFPELELLVQSANRYTLAACSEEKGQRIREVLAEDFLFSCG